ncbi:MAG: class I tRNA ligase family protein [Actinobacteria bacterium]|nr:class I tRNA ligase family protein [Actinomycetota bacterium]
MQPDRVITSPVRLAGGLHLAHLTLLAAADAVVRHHRAAGREVAWPVASLAGDLGAQAAVERQLAQSGQRRTDLGRDAFVERVKAFEVDCRASTIAQLAELGIAVDLEAGTTDREAVASAARTAFVRLFEAGLVKREERVVGTCPWCETVVDRAEAVPAEVPGERLTVRLQVLDDESVELAVDVSAPELLPGVVAVAVPADHPAAGHKAQIPVIDNAVPVVPDDDVAEPVLVVPAHDAVAFVIARRLGLVPIQVLDASGVVRVPGPLDGLARYAARAAARELLEAEGALAAATETVEDLDRCRRCGTVLVPRLGQHWFLPMADLEVAAADAVRQGAVDFAPAGARDDLLARAGNGGDWCLSHQVWAGQPVPVATCLDCGSLEVAVDSSDSCGRCMGTLVADDDVLDARFVGAMALLSDTGWPGDQSGPATAAPGTMLMVTGVGVSWWALPIAALGLRLAEAIPFSHVAVQPVNATADEPDPTLPVDLDARIEAAGRRAVRAALVVGGLDIAAGESLVQLVDSPSPGEGNVDDLVEVCTAAFGAGTPSVAVAHLAGFLAAGIPLDDMDRVRSLVAPVIDA